MRAVPVRSTRPAGELIKLSVEREDVHMILTQKSQQRLFNVAANEIAHPIFFKPAHLRYAGHLRHCGRRREIGIEARTACRDQIGRDRAGYALRWR